MTLFIIIFFSKCIMNINVDRNKIQMLSIIESLHAYLSSHYYQSIKLECDNITV